MKNCVPYKDLRSEAGKKTKDRIEHVNSRGNSVKVRNHHLVDEKLEEKRKVYKEFIKNVDKEIKEKAGNVFFNPYRYSGVYFGCIQALFRLGANEWHSCLKVRNMMEKVMMEAMPNSEGIKPWEIFNNKSAKKRPDGSDAPGAKDLEGRIKQNMRNLQRISIDTEANPYGYKLAQACACIDVRIEEKAWFFRLNTNWKSVEEVKPLFLKIKKKD